MLGSEYEYSVSNVLLPFSVLMSKHSSHANYETAHFVDHAINVFVSPAFLVHSFSSKDLLLDSQKSDLFCLVLVRDGIYNSV